MKPFDDELLAGAVGGGDQIVLALKLEPYIALRGATVDSRPMEAVG